MPFRKIDYKRPPVVETVIGVQFEPIAGFTNAHLGLFWSAVGGSFHWPTAEDKHVLPSEIEKFGAAQQWMRSDQLRLGFSQIPASRMQLWNPTKDRMVQLQPSRLIYNWTATPGSGYARFAKIRPEFDQLLSKLKDFITEQQLPAIAPNSWEVTYVNHIPKGTVWNDISDWNNVFRFHIVPPVAVVGCGMESFGGNWVYEISPERGRLRMQLNHGKNAEDVEVLILKFTATGPIGEGQGVATLEEGLELGHDVIVNAFADLTTDEAQKYWGREFKS